VCFYFLAAVRALWEEACLQHLYHSSNGNRSRLAQHEVTPYPLFLLHLAEASERRDSETA
jgi:hypothetical protein